MALEQYSPSFASRSGKVLLILLPFFTGVICVLLSFVPVGMIIGVNIVPIFGLMVVYHWAVTRPEMLPPFTVFAIGLLFDLLSAGPMGLWALAFVVGYGVIRGQRSLLFGRPFAVFWAGFGASALLTGVVAWVIASLYYGAFLSPAELIIQLVVTVLFFPPFAALFSRVQGRLSS